MENLNITVNPLDTTAPILNEEISQEEIDSNNGVNIGKIKVKTEKNNKTKNISGKIYSQGKSLYFKGEVEGLSGGKMKVMIDNKVKKEINLGNGADWKVKLKFNKSKTYNVQFQYVDSNGNVVDESKKYKVEVDKKKPKFVNLPPFLVKKPGEVIWWKATDNKKIKEYKYQFNGKTRKTKKDSFVIPANTYRGIYMLKVIAYDKADNRATRWMTVRVR